MFGSEINDFNLEMAAIDGYLELIEPLAMENFTSKYAKEIKELSFLKDAFSKLKNVDTDLISDECEVICEELKASFSSATLKKEENSWAITFQGIDATKIKTTAENIKILNTQFGLLHKSILLNMVSAAECFLSNILHKYFRINSDEIVGRLIENKDKIYTFNELKSFENMDDAINSIVDKKIENLIRGNFLDWIEFLKTKMDLKSNILDEYKDQITEIFQRRNIFIHNGGNTNSIYLANVSTKYQYSSTIGEQIVLSKEYLKNSLNVLVLTFSLIAFEIWRKRKIENDTRVTLLTTLSQKYMFEGKWLLTEKLTEFILIDFSADNINKSMAKINSWLAKKRMGLLDKEIVRKEDLSAHSVDYQLCQAALLDDIDLVYELANDALQSNTISKDQLVSWPVLDEFRLTDKYTYLLNENDMLIYEEVSTIVLNNTCSSIIT